MAGESHTQSASPQQLTPSVPGHLARLKVSPRIAAQLLGVSRSLVYRLIEYEHLVASKVGGRWVLYRDSLEKFLEANRNDLS